MSMQTRDRPATGIASIMIKSLFSGQRMKSWVDHGLRAPKENH